MKVQNITGHAVDVPGGAALAPGETAEAKEGHALTIALNAGQLADVTEIDKQPKTKKVS